MVACAQSHIFDQTAYEVVITIDYTSFRAESQSCSVRCFPQRFFPFTSRLRVSHSNPLLVSACTPTRVLRHVSGLRTPAPRFSFLLRARKHIRPDFPPDLRQKGMPRCIRFRFRPPRISPREEPRAFPFRKRFQDAMAEQCKPVHVHGLIAAFRKKAWANAHGFSIRLGTVGVERLWRNLIRQARTKGRAHANVNTIDVIVLSRWIRLMQSRFLRFYHEDGDANSDNLAQLLLSKEKLTIALSGERECKKPLATSGCVPVWH